MHFSREGACMGPRSCVAGPQPRIWKLLGQIFEDRERFPYALAGIYKYRNFPRRRILQNLFTATGLIKRNNLFFEGNAGDLHGDPGTQRPGRIVFIADDERDCHIESRQAFFPWPDSVSGASTGPPAFLQAPNPPSIWATGLSPMWWAVCAARAERSPPAQKNTNVLSAAKTGLWYGLCGSIQNSSMPRGQ